MLEKITVFDVETPSKRNDRICAIGLVRIENGVVVDRKYSLIDPQCEFDDVNIAVHGIKESDVIGAPTFAELWREIEPWFLDCVVAAHNANFDIAVLRKTLNAYGLSFPKLRYMDTMLLAPEFWSDLTDKKLDTICAYLGIEIDHHHAGSDASATAEIVTRMLSAGLDENAHLKTSMSAASECESALVLKNDRARSAATRQLRAIIDSIVKDRTVSASEYESLRTWLSAHEYLSGTYPFDDISKKVQEIERNGVRESSLDDLCDLCVRLLDPVTYLSQNTGHVDVSGLNVVLTGNFHHGDEAEIIRLVTALGGIIQERVTHATDVVLVGGLGHEQWIAKTYGRKIQYAMQLQEKGINIKIVPEDCVLGKMTRRKSAESSGKTRQYKYSSSTTRSPVKNSYVSHKQEYPQQSFHDSGDVPQKRRKRWPSVLRICLGIAFILLAFDSIGTESFLSVLFYLLCGAGFFIWQFWAKIKELWQ